MALAYPLSDAELGLLERAPEIEPEERLAEIIPFKRELFEPEIEVSPEELFLKQLRIKHDIGPEEEIRLIRHDATNRRHETRSGKEIRGYMEAEYKIARKVEKEQNPNFYRLLSGASTWPLITTEYIADTVEIKGKPGDPDRPFGEDVITWLGLTAQSKPTWVTIHCSIP